MAAYPPQWALLTENFKKKKANGSRSPRKGYVNQECPASLYQSLCWTCVLCLRLKKSLTTRKNLLASTKAWEEWSSLSLIEGDWGASSSDPMPCHSTPSAGSYWHVSWTPGCADKRKVITPHWTRQRTSQNMTKTRHTQHTEVHPKGQSIAPQKCSTWVKRDSSNFQTMYQM